MTAAVLNAISVATGGLGLRVSGLFGPTFAQFSPATVAVALKRFAEFVAGGFHTDYDSTPLMRPGTPEPNSSAATSPTTSTDSSEKRAL